MENTDAALGQMLGALLLLNLADLVMTLVYVLTGVAVEANPVMATTMAYGTLPFGASKVALVSLGVALLWRLRRHRAVRYAAGLCLVAYGGVAVVHVLGT